MRTKRMRQALAMTAVTTFWMTTLFVSLGAQAPTQAPEAAAPPVAARGADERPTYDAAGRRDPFVSLARTGATPGTGVRPAGPRGLLIAELSVRGVVQSQGRFLASVVGPDKRTYTLGNGDQLLDGSVKVISEEAVVFVQDVTDPLSPITQREIRKPIRSTEENR